MIAYSIELFHIRTSKAWIKVSEIRPSYSGWLMKPLPKSCQLIYGKFASPLRINKVLSPMSLATLSKNNSYSDNGDRRPRPQIVSTQQYPMPILKVNFKPKIFIIDQAFIFLDACCSQAVSNQYNYTTAIFPTSSSWIPVLAMQDVLRSIRTELRWHQVIVLNSWFGKRYDVIIWQSDVVSNFQKFLCNPI